MTKYFEVKVRYDKTADSGRIESVTENYLVDALSFTEAEARTIEDLKPFVQGDLSMLAMKRSNCSEIIVAEKDGEDGEDFKYFSAKVNFVTLDEHKGKEKKTAEHYFVYAEDLTIADKTVREHMKGTLADYEVAKISETNIIDVIRHESTKV